ncbi:MAG: hypothetical protein P0Y49_14990 [Candidatus Pedobacter colombiensis]|uniref:Uncharacterized protein n=1 Tax=Candidatus Pedobacter colombiensis TaxID=3121371 RepID=A0AAJ5W6M8_9SPHI|nr:hypothetical protein [Pedobacter sp.]WEK18100.1 MAG: hypothetical protein P0Y49_14990 [Pedobacter sp.]
MKHKFLLIIAILFCNNLIAQNSKEVTHDLSKDASKGMLDLSQIAQDGNLIFTYKMKTDKKSDQVSYENYSFDQNLNFKGITPDKADKEKKGNQVVSSISAFVGGSNSFNVLSMKLTLQKEEWEKIWDYGQQKYKWGKRLSKEVVKPKNSEGKYRGFADYQNEDDGSIFIIASAETDKKNEKDQFLALYVDDQLNLKETPFPVNGNYSLVFSGKLQSGNVFSLLAPDKGTGDLSKYVYIEFSPKGDVIYNSIFTAPAQAMAVMDYQEANGALYFCAASPKKAEAYNSVFENYAPIGNPGYTTSSNFLMDKYEKKIYNQDFANFHLLKIDKGQLAFASTTPINTFKAMVKTPPSQKRATPYNGKKLVIQNFTVTPGGEYLVTGQLEDKKIINGGNTIQHYYYDIVCLHFDANGALKAQYAVEKINDDKKSEMFQSRQKFFFSADGKTAFWELLEVKGSKGYDSFIDAFNGKASIIPQYFPRIANINLTAGNISDFKVLGDSGKFLLYKFQSYIFDEKTKNRFYLGHDEDYKKIWIGKYLMDN